MKNKADDLIRSILEIADRMVAISEQGIAACEDDGCLLLNGLVLECAYRLRDAAEQEREVHGTRGNRDGAQVKRTAGAIGRSQGKGSAS